MSRSRDLLPPAPPLGPMQSLAFRGFVVLVALLRRLPDRPVYRATYVLGMALSPLLRRRRARVRANLSRVCRWLVEHDQASPQVAAAARDRRALDRLVRAAFGHWLLGYAESVMAPRYGAAELRARFVPADPAASREALAPRPPGEVGVIHISLHFGSVDLSAVYGSRVGMLPVTGPMEVVASPLARAVFEHLRGELEVTIVPVGDAAVELVAALRRGEAVGLVADRNIVGSGAAVELFGAPARLPIGPAVLAAQTGAPVWLQAIERTAPGAWLGHSIAIRPAPGLSRREAVRSMIEAEARAFERVVARAPEQWTTLSFPIWSDRDEP